ncbi:MAG: DMT family transporter [Hyphomicrobiales bacterium]|nr:DMT family transporter [Hyphomicrobiales bacterium]
MAPDWLWALVTLAAASAQTLRNAMQRDLIGALGAVGAAQVRFLFALPFAALFLLGALAATGLEAPSVSLADLGWTAFAALSQVIATALMLAAMSSRSFVVAVAYTKTEPAQIALFGLVALNETLSLQLVSAIALATLGVVLMSVTSRRELAHHWRAAALGVISATFFAFAAVGFRAAVVSVATPSPVIAASTILLVGLLIQSATLIAWLALFDSAGARAILREWRGSLAAGFTGALASQFWFVAFALSDAARVRTLGLIEVPLAQIVSLKVFREPPSLREIVGMSLIVAAAAILVRAEG